MDELMDEEIIKNALSDSKMMNSLFKITTNQDFFAHSYLFFDFFSCFLHISMFL